MSLYKQPTALVLTNKLKTKKRKYSKHTERKHKTNQLAVGKKDRNELSGTQLYKETNTKYTAGS